MNSEEKIQPHYDVIVVGARVAGAATAMLLARFGINVLVVERGHPGSDTLSTLALMRAGVIQLHRWGLLDAVREAGTPPVRTTMFHYGEETLTVEIGSAFGVDALYAPRRTVLDPILVGAAQASGATVRFRVSVDSLKTDATGRVIGIAGHDEHRQPFEARCSIVIGADGAKSVVARSTGAQITQSARGIGSAIYGFFPDVDTGAYEWAFNPGVAGGVIPTNGGVACVFASTTSQRFQDELRSDLEAGFSRILTEVNPKLAQRVADSEPVERLRGFPGLGSYLRKSWGPGWALVGDAGYFKDPITAHGISDALRDAELLARAVRDGVEDPNRESEALANYETTRDHVSKTLLEVTDRVARYDWTLPEVQDLHRQLSRSMKAENKLLGSLDVPASAGLEAQSPAR
jgi:2-polyprenyl-6-methoxyphenol hydroxylase-like FAD-dependent oxidoreductase